MTRPICDDCGGKKYEQCSAHGGTERPCAICGHPTKNGCFAEDDIAKARKARAARGVPPEHRPVSFGRLAPGASIPRG